MERYRATVGGQIVQDIDQYARHCQLYKSFKSKDVNEMDDIESSANPSWDDDYHRYANCEQASSGLPPRNHTPAAVFSARWFHVWLQMLSPNVPSQALWLEPKTTYTN